jgi:uncharacterized protein YeaO (DUF488 family)
LFGHVPAGWVEFCWRYLAKLRAHRDALAAIAGRTSRARAIMRLFGTRDSTHNNVRALKGVIERRRKWYGGTRRRAA